MFLNGEWMQSKGADGVSLLTLASPRSYLVERSSRKKLFFDSSGAPRPVVNSKGKRRRPSTKTLSSALNCNDDLFLDFLTKCLHWDPERR